MPDLTSIFDTYERRARVYPMLLVLLPAALGLERWAIPDMSNSLSRRLVAAFLIAR